MTMLHVIRHGRASALEADYDQLHATGELQARALGAHLAREGQRFNAVYVGPLRRQLETLRLMRDEAGAVGAAWPEAHVLPGLAEGPFEIMMKKYALERLDRDAALQRFVADYRDATDDAGRELALTSIFDHVIVLWRDGEIAGADLEPAQVFAARVADALSHIADNEGRGREVAVVTSNGVIAAWVERTQNVADVPVPLRMRVHNSSVSRLELSVEGLLLRAHDLTAHLTDPEHLTLL
jgi:broad specificity phosphatase PhoE